MTNDVTLADPTPDEDGLDPLVVCSLPADSLSERLAWIRSEILPHAIASEPGPDGIAWELEDAPGLVTKLDHLVALERECCSGVTFERGASRTAGRVRFEVRGIDPRAPVLSALHVAAEETPRLGAKLARAAGLGALLSLVVCCVLPIAAAAFLGAAAAAPFASLDQPWMMVGAALGFGGAAFVWENRRCAIP